MKLIDIIRTEEANLPDEILVQYRTIIPSGADIFTGCFTIDKSGKINSLDHDSYSCDDEICEYYIRKNSNREIFLECYHKF